MDSRDEELTLENVDELVEQHLARPQAYQPPSRTSLTHVVHNLQNIYEEERLERVWERISRERIINSVSAEIDANTVRYAEGLAITQPAPEIKTVPSHTHGQSFSTTWGGAGKQLPPRRKKWYGLAIGLVAAILLITFLLWPMLSYALHNSESGNARVHPKGGTPAAQPTVSALNMREYASQNFKIQYPINWVITSQNMGGQSTYPQKVQLRPTGTSSVFVNVDALATTTSSTEQLLLSDPDVKLGTLSGVTTVTYNGIAWRVGIVKLVGSAQVETGQLEIAYSNQVTPYRIEFGATSAMFNAYTNVFNVMFASFSVQKSATNTTGATVPTITPTASTPTVMPTATPVPTSTSISTPTPVGAPSPTATAGVSGSVIKVYSDLYFTIQYPGNWVMTSVTQGGVYQETVQFRPAATSPVFVDINILYSSDLSSSLLLLTDPIVKLGALLTTNTVTYNGLSWIVGTVNLLGSAQTPASEVEIAYSNQTAPYKIEFSAPADTFNSYTAVFNTMLASFSAAN